MPTTTAVYTTTPETLGGPLSMRRGGQSSFYVPDLQGTSRQLADGSQNVSDTLLSDAWGKQISSTGATVNPYKAFGQWGYYADAPNRQYVRARVQRNDLGRWLIRNPAPLAMPGRAYDYANNMPTIIVDPSGWLGIKVSDEPLWKIGQFKNQNQLRQCCGKYAAYWLFILAGKYMDKTNVAPRAGFIVQHIFVDLRDITPCPENSNSVPLPQSIEYTEVWPMLQAGDEGPPTRDPNKPLDQQYDDRFTLGRQLQLGFPHYRGKIEQTGIAKFFCLDTLIKLGQIVVDSSGKFKIKGMTKNCEPNGWPGGLECMLGPAPDWFTKTKSEDDGSEANHCTSAEWCCCGSDKTKWTHKSVADPSIEDTTHPC